MGIKKGDTVIVLSGKDKGKKGKVIEVFAETGKVSVEAVNVAKKHQRATRTFPGGIIDRVMPLAAAKLMLVCPRCHEPSRTGTKEVNDKRVRVCKKCSEIMDKV